MKFLLHLCSTLAVVATLFTVASPVIAAERPLRMLVGFPPGGSSDLAARIFAEGLSQKLSRPVIVENKAGAGGTIAANEIMRAEPDGNTVLYATSSIVFAPLIYKSVKFDPLKDFTPVALTATNPLVVLVNKNVPATTLAEFLQWAKKEKALNYGSTGAGTMNHLTGAALVSEFKLQANHVPYRGAAPALVDLASGNIPFMVSALSEALVMLQDGRVRALAITSKERSGLLPKVATVQEQTGSEGFFMGGWQAIVLPPATPAAIAQQLNLAVNEVIQDPVVQKKFEPQGTELLGGTPAALADYMSTETSRWSVIVREAGASMD